MSDGRDMSPRVLVIDDDEVDRDRVRRAIAKAGWPAEILEAADPDDPAADVRISRPDVVVLDYGFPRSDGLKALRRLRAEDRWLPVVVLTGRDDASTAVELMKAGASDYIPKSMLTPERLVQSLHRGLRLAEAQRAALRRRRRCGPARS